jgi:hypothetical protein
MVEAVSRLERYGCRYCRQFDGECGINEGSRSAVSDLGLSSGVVMSEFATTGNLNADCQGASRMKAIMIYSVQSLQSGLVFAE